MPDADRWRASRSDLWVLLLLLLIVGWVFRGIILGTSDPFLSALRSYDPWRNNLTAADVGPESFAKDPTTQTYPWAIYAHEHLQNGDFPLWNTRMFSGTPFIANRLTGLFDPLILLPIWLLPPKVGLSVFYFVHYLLAAWFMYLFLKCLGLSRPSATFGAIAYVLQGAYVPWMGFIVADKCYIIASLYYLERTCDRGDKVGVVGYILFFALMAITSYPQMSVFGLYLSAGWVLFTRGPGLIPAARRSIGLVVMLILAFLLGAMQHLPTLEFFSLSLRAQPEFQEELLSLTRLEQHDTPMTLLAIFFPRLWGDYLQSPVSSIPEYVLRIYNHAYIGILAAVGALMAPMVWRNRYARFFTVLFLIALLFVAWHGLYAVVARILPGFRISTVKPIFLGLTSMIIVASFVLDHFLKNLRLNARLARRFMRGYGWLLGLVLGLAIFHVISRFVPGLVTGGDYARFMSVFAEIAILWLVGAVFYLHIRRGLAVKWVIGVIIVAELVDLVPYQDHFMPLIPRGRTCFKTRSIEYLQEHMESEGPFRVFRDRNIVMPPNSPMILGLDEIGGFDSFVSAGYAHFFRSIDPVMSMNSRGLNMPGEYKFYREPFWAFLGVRYLLSPTPMSSLPSPWRYAWSGYDDLYIHENLDWLPRWFLVPRIVPVETVEEGYWAARAIDPEREAVVVGIKHEDIPPALLEGPYGQSGWLVNQLGFPAKTEEEEIGDLTVEFYGADELRLAAQCERDCFLVFSDTYFPGWRAWIDEEQVEVYRADAVVKGVVVPAGAHSVRFLYDPPLYKIGWLLVFLGVLLTPFLVGPIRRLYAERDSEDEQSSTS